MLKKKNSNLKSPSLRMKLFLRSNKYLLFATQKRVRFLSGKRGFSFPWGKEEIILRKKAQLFSKKGTFLKLCVLYQKKIGGKNTLPP